MRASDLKRQRGWTETLVVTLLGAPDALSPNPHGWRAPMRWYRQDRVLDAERADAFKAWAGQLPQERTWRRELPTRTWAPDEVQQLEWLDDPARIALFHAPRRPRVRRRRRRAEAPGATAPATTMYPLPRFEILRLF
ncbi:MAG TPA: hypothetical protein VNT03_15780 [Baekduia sp.]|nr:hypothetical protein [Baekduia sp.]